MLHNFRFTAFFGKNLPAISQRVSRSKPFTSLAFGQITQEVEMDLQPELQEIRRRRKRARRKPYRVSRLDRHRAEIEALRKMDASLEDIRLWLRRYRRVHITRRAILYRLRRWEESQS